MLKRLPSRPPPRQRFGWRLLSVKLNCQRFLTACEMILVASSPSRPERRVCVLITQEKTHRQARKPAENVLLIDGEVRKASAGVFTCPLILRSYPVYGNTLIIEMDVYVSLSAYRYCCQTINIIKIAYSIFFQVSQTAHARGKSRILDENIHCCRVQCVHTPIMQRVL